METEVVVALFGNLDGVLVQGELLGGVLGGGDDDLCHGLDSGLGAKGNVHLDGGGAAAHVTDLKAEDVLAGGQMDGHRNQPVVVVGDVGVVGYHAGTVAVYRAVLPFAVVAVDIDGGVVLDFGTGLAHVVGKGYLDGVCGGLGGKESGGLRGLRLLRSQHCAVGHGVELFETGARHCDAALRSLCQNGKASQCQSA